jgi:16S rRNA G966 N2-methylase RsmD
MKPITENTLFYGDNLFILHEHIPSESIDLIYLDPPFNSSRNYNVLFKDEHVIEHQGRVEFLLALLVASLDSPAFSGTLVHE